MSEPKDYETLNKAKWDERAAVVRIPPSSLHSPKLTTQTPSKHAASKDYNLHQFLSSPTYISETVKFDLPLLGSITGLECVHLQCHIGTDTLSLARLGAASVTGLDFSSKSLDEARRLAALTAPSGGDKLSFVEASVYDALGVLEAGNFDLVFTGIGALCWIPSIKEWAGVVEGLLRPGGRLFIREGHPVLWALDQTAKDEVKLELPYFERPEPTITDKPGTYVEAGGHEFVATVGAEFNHGMGEIVTALLERGMRIVGLTEHDSTPWEALPGQMDVDHRGRWCL
jgi:SAM-dependent methyltransferase